MNLKDQQKEFDKLISEIHEILEEDCDYGKAGANITKPSLLQPGALKLIKFFGYEKKLERTMNVIDHDKQIAIVEYKCTLTKRDGDKTEITEAFGMANSKEPTFAGKMGSSGQHFLVKANTMNQIAEKRAIVRAIRMAEPALTALFTQDIEDLTKEQHQELEERKYNYNAPKVVNHVQASSESAEIAARNTKLQKELQELFVSMQIFRQPTKENFKRLLVSIQQRTKSSDFQVWIDDLKNNSGIYIAEFAGE